MSSHSGVHGAAPTANAFSGMKNPKNECRGYKFYYFYCTNLKNITKVGGTPTASNNNVPEIVFHRFNKLVNMLSTVGSQVCHQKVSIIEH